MNDGCGSSALRIWFNVATFICPSKILGPKYIESGRECGRVVRERLTTAALIYMYI